MLGIVSDDVLEKELDNVSKSNKLRAPQIIIKDLEHGRGKGNNQIPDSLRAIISHSVLNREGTQKEIAEVFDVSPSSVSAYKNDATSTDSYDDPNESLVKANNDFKNQITERARQNLMTALEHITEEKLSKAKLRDISSTAKDMSSVIGNLTPKNDGIIVNGNKVLVYRPRLRQEDEYETILVND